MEGEKGETDDGSGNAHRFHFGLVIKTRFCAVIGDEDDLFAFCTISMNASPRCNKDGN